MFNHIDPRSYDGGPDWKWIIPEGTIVQYHRQSNPWLPKLKRTKKPIWVERYQDYAQAYVIIEIEEWYLLVRKSDLRPVRG